MTPEERIADLEGAISDLHTRREALPNDVEYATIAAKLATAAAMAHRELDALYRNNDLGGEALDQLPDGEIDRRVKAATERLRDLRARQNRAKA